MKTDGYDRMMNLATPVLICERSEEFRSLLRDMLTKHGFFHVIEAASEEEAFAALAPAADDFFTIIESQFVNGRMIELLEKSGHYIVLAQPEDPSTVGLSARLGVKRFLSFPFSSQGLLEKVQQIL